MISYPNQRVYKIMNNHSDLGTWSYTSRFFWQKWSRIRQNWNPGYNFGERSENQSKFYVKIRSNMTLRDLSHIMSCFEGDSCRRYSYWVLSNDIRNPIGYFCSLCSLVSILADFKFVSSITFKSDLRIRKCV